MIRSLLIAGTVLLGLTGTALADTAFTNGVFVNIRSGPGTKYSVICLAWPGVRFTVSDCGKNWCAADYLGKKGWISAHHITI